MKQTLTFEIEHDGEWFIGSCPQVPAANGQGRTLMSCSKNLVQAIALVLDDQDPTPISSTVEVQLATGRQPYRVELLQSLEGFSVSCPDLPGCFSQGDDADEALDNIREAIKDYLEVAGEMKQENAALVKVA